MRHPLIFAGRARPRLSLRAYLAVLAVACVLPMAVFAVWLTVAIARDQRAALREGMRDTVRALAIAVDRDLREDVHTLEALAASRALDEPDPDALEAELRAIAATRPDWLGLGLYAPDGRRLLATAGGPEGPAARGPERIGVEGLLERGRAVVPGPAAFGPRSFAMYVPVVRAGRLRAVLAATVSGSAVGEVFRQQGLPEGWVGSLVDGRGVALAASDDGAIAGDRVTELPLAAMAAREGWGGRVSLATGTYYVAYARPELTGWHVVLAAPVAALDRPWLRSLGAIVVGGAAFLALGVALAALAGRPITRSLTRLAAAAADLGGGRTPAPIDSPVTDVDAVGRDLEAAGRARERAEHAVRAREAQLSAIVNQATAGIAETDLEGRFTLVNRRYCEMVGRSSDEVSHLSFADTIQPEHRSRADAALRGLSPDEPEAAIETRCARPDGSLRWVDASLSLVREAGAPRSVAIVALDATDRRTAEEAARAGDRERRHLLARERQARQEAEAASQAKDEFLAVVSHELRTPLNAVRLWAGILKTGPTDPSTIVQAAETIDRNAVLQARLIEDLLDASRVLSGRLRLALARVDLAAVVTDAIDAARPAADNKGLALVAALDPGIGPVLGDPTRLHQVVWNLLSNAVRFTSTGGRVTVLLSQQGRDAHLTVTDTGRGIAPDLLPRVFDRFRQGESGTTRSHGGLGLGLSIARQIVQLHGGTIEAASEGEGRGATFTVCLPVTAALGPPAAEPTRAAPSSPAGGPARRLQHLDVLVVDDDPETREVVGLTLGLEGARVTTAGSVPDALAAMDRRWPDVLVSDIGMPGEDGFDLIREVRRREPAHPHRVPAIALTAYAGAEDRRRALAAGYAAHVAKPVEPSALAPLILTVLTEKAR